MVGRMEGSGEERRVGKMGERTGGNMDYSKCNQHL
jgi:hypothetical protein